MRRLVFKLLVVVFSVLTLLPVKALAADAPGNFSLQVSPSPIVQTVKPGESSSVEIQIRNNGTATEQLKMGLQAFTVDNDTGKVNLKTEQPKDVKDWVTFAEPEFSVGSGTLYTQKVFFAVPANAGFNYSFAVVVSRAKPTTGTAGKTAIEGSIAIFTLLTVDRPGATKKVDVVSFSSKKKVYEFLPGDFTLKLKNDGNTIVAPSGNIFIQRNSKSATPLAVLSINQTGAYVLPDITREVTTSWTDGFPLYKTDSNGKSHLTWDWGKLQNLRFGHYVAKAVVIYNDGTRDIPVEATVGFWVIPWRLLFGALIFVVLVIVGIVSTLRKTAKITHKKDKNEQDKPKV